MELFCTEYSHLDSTNRIFTLQVAAPKPDHHFIRGDDVVQWKRMESVMLDRFESVF